MCSQGSRGLRRHREREITFEVKRSWRMPDLSRLTPGDGAVETSTDELRAIYYDTRDRTLQRLGVTLRRRTGGADAGWHLKVADGPARMEFQSQARSQRVPESLSRRVAGVLAGQELAEVATITTTRCATRLLDEQGQLLAEVADDRVIRRGRRRGCRPGPLARGRGRARPGRRRGSADQDHQDLPQGGRPSRHAAAQAGPAVRGPRHQAGPAYGQPGRRRVPAGPVPGDPARRHRAARPPGA